MRLLLTAIVAALLTSCATPGGSGGSSTGSLFPNDEQHEAAAKKAIQSRTAFDLDCTEVELTRISDVTRLGQQVTSMSLGARGCGKKASYYVECVSNWGKITCNPRLNSKE